MGSILHFDGGEPRVAPLAPVTLVGRGAGCFVRVTHPRVPLHWLEVRWLGDVWAWRALGGQDLTRGPGTFLAAGWRSLGTTGRVARVSLGDLAWVELTDAAPPAPFAWDMVRDVPVSADLFARTFTWQADTLVVAGAESPRPLRDGEVVAIVDAIEGPSALRVHLPGMIETTADASLDLLAPDVSLDIDLVHLRATLHQHHASVTVRGECVRVLSVYARARARVADGWLTPHDAWDAWVTAGGNAASGPDRLSWERGKLRARLVRLHVANVDALFEIVREGVTVRTRLGSQLNVL